MRHYLLLSLLCLLAVTAVVGCKKEPPPPPPQPEAPPPPSVEQIYSEIRNGMQMFWDPVEGKFHTLLDGPRDQGIEHVRSCKAKYSMMDNGREALSRVSRDVEEIIRRAKPENRWKLIKGCCMLYQVLEPGSERFKKVEERADLMIARPDVHVKGFVQMTDGLYAFLEVMDPATKAITTYKVREGEEFHGVVRLVRIIGNQQSVELLYIPVNDTWEVKGPRELK